MELLVKRVCEKFGDLGFSGRGVNAYEGLVKHGLLARHEINGGVNKLRAIWIAREPGDETVFLHGSITFNEIIERSLIAFVDGPESPILIDQYAFFEEHLHTTRACWVARKDVDSYILRLYDLYKFLGPRRLMQKYREISFEELLSLEIPDIYAPEYKCYHTL